MVQDLPPDEPARLTGPISAGEFKALMIAIATLDEALSEAIHADPVEITTSCFGESGWEFKLMVDGTDAEPSRDSETLMRAIAIIARPVGREYESDGLDGIAVHTTPFVTRIGARSSATVRAAARARAPRARAEAARLLREFADRHARALRQDVDAFAKERGL